MRILSAAPAALPADGGTGGRRYPRMNGGGFILVHDYNAWPGARKAVDEFCRDKREVPIPMPDKSGSALVVRERHLP